MTHAIIYDRASTGLQKDNYSRVNAKEVGIRVAEQNNFTWEYIKEIGSGTTLTGRPEMMKILDRIEAGEVQVLIVQELDRLARPEEAVVYGYIREVIMEYNIIIYTHTSHIDLNNNNDDFVADITMSVAKKERRRILKRMKRGRKARAEAGKFIGGRPGTGYTIIGQDNSSDFVVDPVGAGTVKVVFNTLEATGGNLSKAAQELNAMGCRGAKGNKFSTNTVRWIATRKLYIGIFETKISDKIMHRPDLQIINVEQFNRVQELINSRAGNNRDLGRRGKYIFTGFVACATCGGIMVAANNGTRILYQCQNRRFKKNCTKGSCYAEHLILPPIVDFLAGFIQNQLDFHSALDVAAAQYGKSITEEAIEATIQGELASVKAGKQRIIEAISLGILANEEAAVKLAELRKQEQRLIIELSSIAEKTTIITEWQAAIESLKGQDIEKQLLVLAKKKPVAFRRLLSLVFEPNSLRVKTFQINSREWGGSLESCKLTEAMENMGNEGVFLETNLGFVV